MRLTDHVDHRVGAAAGLLTKIRLASGPLGAVTHAFWTHPGLRALFPRYLLAVHGSVRATVPLLEAAARRCRALASGAAGAGGAGSDEVAAALAPYYARHADEERDHEMWLLADMQAVGLEPADVVRHVPPAPVADLAGAQYYWIRHAHPVALLGFLAVLEGHPPSAARLDEVRARTGLPAEAFRMLREHAELDPAHGAEVFAVVDALPLDDAAIALVGLSALHTIERLVAVYEDLLGAAIAAPDDAPR